MKMPRGERQWTLLLIAFLWGIIFMVTLVRSCRAQSRPASYVALQSAFVFSAGFDLASTLYYYPRCQPWCNEQNGLLAPALEHSPAAAILVGATLTAATLWVADQVWKHKKLGRKVWWLIPIAGTLNHALAARANILLMRGR